MKLLTSFLREDEGQGLAEYALIIALVAIAVMAAVAIFSGKLTTMFSNSAEALPDGTVPTP